MKDLVPTRAAIATMLAALGALAACTHVSLKEPPPVVERSSDGSPTVVPAQGPDQGGTYVVRRDDTLASVAARFRTTPAQLAAWNGLGPNPRIVPNQVLRVSPPSAPPVDAGPVATPQPIGNEGVESRPIGSPSSSVASTAAMPSNAPLKTGPLGVKRPYSDQALAEMSQADAAGTAAPPVVASIAPATPVTSVASQVSWAWPTAERVARGFDEKSKGIDFSGRAGDPVLAAADGRVTFANAGVRGYGNFVIVQHTPELLSVYANNRANLVREGATVTKGQKIAEMGSSDADTVKLHFEIRRDSKPVDPLQYLPPR